MTEPFRYPTTAHVRHHGPSGYAGYESYRPWLRDEFAFRCVYCLWREQWGKTRGAFHMDHRTAVSQLGSVTDYDNLAYCCASCNLVKLAVMIPDPLTSLVAATASVGEDGEITTSSPEAERIVELLDLNSDEKCEMRARLHDMIELLSALRPEQYRKWMGYTADLPDLSGLKPPGGNSRPEGVEHSHFTRKQRGELPETY